MRAPFRDELIARGMIAAPPPGATGCVGLLSSLGGQPGGAAAPQADPGRGHSTSRAPVFGGALATAADGLEAGLWAAGGGGGFWDLGSSAAMPSLLLASGGVQPAALAPSPQPPAAVSAAAPSSNPLLVDHYMQWLLSGAPASDLPPAPLDLLARSAWQAGPDAAASATGMHLALAAAAVGAGSAPGGSVLAGGGPPPLPGFYDPSCWPPVTDFCPPHTQRGSVEDPAAAGRGARGSGSVVPGHEVRVASGSDPMLRAPRAHSDPLPHLPVTACGAAVEAAAVGFGGASGTCTPRALSSPLPGGASSALFASPLRTSQSAAPAGAAPGATVTGTRTSGSNSSGSGIWAPPLPGGSTPAWGLGCSAATGPMRAADARLAAPSVQLALASALYGCPLVPSGGHGLSPAPVPPRSAPPAPLGGPAFDDMVRAQLQARGIAVGPRTAAEADVLRLGGGFGRGSTGTGGAWPPEEQRGVDAVAALQHRLGAIAFGSLDGSAQDAQMPQGADPMAPPC